ncbi:MAG TPA: dihydrolipoamide acetyltransferase family protein [Burkholderiaceae bacterium]|nr:dihydrolipoamide acetyltransferase family protein [Burkholderiaceae bacterium]
MIEFRMPSLGADMEAGTFIEWNIAPGQAVKRGDVVCVVETEKGAVDVEIWASGTVARLVAEPGKRIPVGGILALLAAEGEDWQAVAATPAAPAEAPRPSPAPAPAPALVRSSPAARKRAEELGVDVAALAAKKGGAPITLADVEAAAKTAPRASAPAVAGEGAARTGMRQAIAAAMARSKREIPHYYLGCEVDVERAATWLEQFNAGRPIGERVLFAALAFKAIALALRDVPDLNGVFVDGAFRPSAAIHLGVVTSLREGGVINPALHDADKLGVPALMAALRDLLMRVRAGQLRSSDLADATTTVTNLGDLGVETVYGVIYPPQVALIGLGRVVARPIVREQQIVASRMLTVTLSADHRVTDGMTGARFLSKVREHLAQPEAL